MANTLKRTHFYSAEGNALGGTITRPHNQIVASQANASLPETGGFVSSVGHAFHHDKLISCSGSYCHVAGGVNPKSGGYTTLVTSVVEGLNILDIVTADRVVARISSEHPAVGYTPKVTLVGSNFINLRIAGFPVEAVLNFDLLNPPDQYPESPWLRNAAFIETIRQQYRSRAKSPVAQEIEQQSGWIESDEGIEQRGYIVCSLVDRIAGRFPGESSGNLVVVPEVGRFYFGELIVDQGTFTLSMIRAELGSPIGAAFSGPIGSTNGHTYP